MEMIDVNDEQSDSLDFADEKAGVIGVGVSLGISLGVVGLWVAKNSRILSLASSSSHSEPRGKALVIPRYVLIIPELCSQKLLPIILKFMPA